MPLQTMVISRPQGAALARQVSGLATKQASMKKKMKSKESITYEQVRSKPNLRIQDAREKWR